MILLELAARFTLLSFLAVGGANATLPEAHRQIVTLARWMDDGTFASLFAVAQAAPGPNVLFVALVGANVAGLAGALVAMIAICAPSGLLAVAISGVWERFRAARWRRVIQAAITPVTIGLVSASGWLLARSASAEAHEVPVALAVTAVAGAAAFATRLNPIWVLAGAAALGAAGLV